MRAGHVSGEVLHRGVQVVDAADVLEYLAVAEDGSGVHGHAARTINVAARFVQAGTWLPIRFCLFLEP
jgi:hypothetical protein